MKLKQQYTLFLLVSLISSIAYSADRFDPLSTPIGSIAPLESNNKHVDASIKIYRPWFENLNWQGDLIEYEIHNDQDIVTSVNMNGLVPDSSNSDNWSALSNLSKKGPHWWNTDRKIIFLKDGNQTGFRFNHLSDAQKENLSEDIVNYIRGDQSKEFSNGGSYRDRNSILGAIIHSNPFYIATASEWIKDPEYIDFIKQNKDREPEIIVGANDGMVHIFNAETGQENYAYVPSMVMSQLHKLAVKEDDLYNLNYSVDGQINVRDARLDNKYAKVAVGGLGAGGKGIWALNVTYSGLQSENFGSSETSRKILWEFKPELHSDLGHIYGRPNIARLMDADGNPKYYIVTGNGFNSDSGNAVLYIINISDGTVEKKISVANGSFENPNGLSMPALIDVDKDGVIDYGYAGTIDGEMFKFTFGSGKANWKSQGKIFDTPSGSKTPIITVPQVAKHPKKAGFLVIFATGRLFTESDINDVTTQWVYGIWDPSTSDTLEEVEHSNLVEQKISSAISAHGGVSHSISNHPIDWESKSGWRVPLDQFQGLRTLTDPGLRNKRLKLTITKPDSSKNWDMELFYENGGSSGSTIIDQNGDNQIDDTDKSQSAIPIVFYRGEGIRSEPKFIRMTDDFDAIIHNSLKLIDFTLVEEKCTENCGIEICTGSDCGVAGGHFDADSYDNDYHDDSTTHVHEYDDKNSTNHLDFIDTTGISKPIKRFNPIDGEKYIIVMANADLSPGGVLRVGTNAWNVLDYQAMIHEKLLDWDGSNTNDLTDNNGIPLVFTKSDVVCSGCKLGVTFDVNALAMGGLIPTQTGCVKGSDDWELRNGRRRDGSLLTYVIKLVEGQNPLKSGKLDRQKPNDLADKAVIKFNNQIKQINLAGSLNGKEDFGGLLPLGNSPYSTSLFWHYKGACYDDYNDWKKERAEAIIRLFECKDDYYGCKPGTTGDPDLDSLFQLLRSAGIIATSYSNAITSTWAFCEDSSNSNHEKYNEICLGDNSAIALLEAFLPGDNGGGNGSGQYKVEINDNLDSTLSPITKSKVGSLPPYGRKSWVEQ